MAERLFLGAVLLVAAAYLAVAWTSISAPIQYDPLGPESWPIILGIALVVAAGARLAMPVGVRPGLERRAAGRLALVVLAMVLFAFFFARAGFVLSAWAFAGSVTWLLGTRPLTAALFGLAVGVGGYALFTALDLTLPAGVLAGLL